MSKRLNELTAEKKLKYIFNMMPTTYSYEKLIKKCISRGLDTVYEEVRNMRLVSHN